jgi:hypothetical protein
MLSYSRDGEDGCEKFCLLSRINVDFEITADNVV